MSFAGKMDVCWKSVIQLFEFVCGIGTAVIIYLVQKFGTGRLKEPMDHQPV